MGRPFFFPDLEMQVAGFNTVGRAYLSDILALMDEGVVVQAVKRLPKMGVHGKCIVPVGQNDHVAIASAFTQINNHAVACGADARSLGRDQANAEALPPMLRLRAQGRRSDGSWAGTQCAPAYEELPYRFRARAENQKTGGNGEQKQTRQRPIS